MILRSICVAGWRCFLEPVELGPFADGLSVIHAPNGTGKSTIFEAVRHVLLDGHRVAGREVEALRPWGRDLAPRATVEFLHAGAEYRLTKQFLVSPSALLERKEGGRWRPLAEGVKADEDARVVLSHNPPGRGLARRENWGLAQVLWAPQGGLELAALSDDLVANIRSMLSAQVSGPGADPIERRIEERYLEYFSPTGKMRTGKDAPRLARLEAELEGARQALLEARQLQQSFDAASRRVEELRAQRVQSGYDAQELTRALNETRQRAEAYRGLLAEKDRRQEQAHAAEAQYSWLKQRVDLIEQAEQELAGARETVATLESEAPMKNREAQARAREAERTKVEVEDARKGRVDVDRAEQEAEDARLFVDGTKVLGELDNLIDRIRGAQSTLAEQRQKRGELSAPDGKVLRALRQAMKEQDEAQLHLEASLISLEVVPEKDGCLEVVAGEQVGSVPLTAGAPTRTQGSPEVVAVIPGVARLRASGPTGSVDEYRSRRAKAEEKIGKLTGPYGSANLEALEGLADRAKQIDEATAEAQTRLETLLSGKTIEDRNQARTVAKAELAKVVGVHPDWVQAAPSSSALKAKAEEIRRGFIARVERAEEEWSKAHSALTAAAGEQEMLAARLKEARNRVDSLARKLAEYTSDGKSAQERSTDLGRLAMAWAAAGARLSELQREVEAYVDDPEATAAALARQLEGASEAAGQARERELREETRLEGLTARGPYSALVLAEEEVNRLEQEVERERLRVEAVRYLREALAKCRAEAIAAVAAPVEAAATRTFQRIASRRLGRVQIGEAFAPAAVVPEASIEGVGVESISWGEREQLYLATRLALAEVLARDERQLVALDDVLTATDAGRRARVMTVLEEAAQRLQVLILTCHPEHYRGLREARFFDLEAIVENRP